MNVKLKTTEAVLCWLPELRKDNDETSDVVLHTIEGSMTYAHAFVLGAVASRNVISALTKVHEMDADKLHISLSGHTKQQLDKLLDFIYGKLETFDDVEIWKDLFVFHDEEVIGEVKDEDEDDDDVETETETSRTSSSIENLSSRTASAMRLNACWDDSENFETSITEDVDEEEEDSDHRININSIRKKRLKRFPDKKDNALGALTPSSKVWTCPECQEEIGLFPEMLQHLNKVHPEVAAYGRKIACENCAEHFETKEGFLIHHHGTDCQSAGEGEKRFQCQECPLSFRGFRNLEVHANLQHLSQDQSTRWTLNNRWSVFYCECCLKVFHRVNLLRSHQEKVHKIRRGYFTQDYDKLSMEMQAAETKSSRSELKKASQHFCKTCNKEFSSKTSFVKHLRDRHQGGGDDQVNDAFECKRCGESCRSRRAYLSHMKECGRTIPCKQCSKMFATQKSLNNHVTTFHNQQIVHEKVLVIIKHILHKHLYGSNVVLFIEIRKNHDNHQHEQQEHQE